MTEELYDALLAHARRVCVGRAHVLEAEDLLHQALVRAVEQGWLDSPGRLFSHVSWGIRHALADRARALHLGRVPHSTDATLNEAGFNLGMTQASPTNVAREVEARMLLETFIGQVPQFPGIWARVAAELGYTDAEVAATLGIEERVLRRLRRALAFKGERVIEVCTSCRRQAPLDPEFMTCASCRIPDVWEQLPLPPAPMTRPKYPRAVRPKAEPVLKPVKWSKLHDECVQCGRADSKHVSKGVCNRCYTKAKYASGERVIRKHRLV